MGTYNDSRVRTARKWWACHAHDCNNVIQIGDEYLDYRMGQRVSFRLCIKCAELERGNVACLPRKEATDD